MLSSTKYTIKSPPFEEEKKEDMLHSLKKKNEKVKKILSHSR